MNKIVLITFVLISTALMGSSFSVGKIGLAYVSPLLMVGLRFVMAGITMAVFVGLTQKTSPERYRNVDENSSHWSFSNRRCFRGNIY